MPFLNIEFDPYRVTSRMPQALISPASVRTVNAPRLKPNTKMRSPGS